MNMNPANFFISGRHLFGFIVPGILWIVSVMLWIKQDLADFSQLTVYQLVALLAAGLVVGHAVGDLSFSITIHLSSWMHKWSLISLKREQAWADIDELQARVGEILQEKKPDE